MTTQILGRTRFFEFGHSWEPPAEETLGFQRTSEGIILAAPPDETRQLNGAGVHTRAGDSIELRFKPLRDAGSLRFGFDAARHEFAMVELDFASGVLSLFTTDWTTPQPIAATQLSINKDASHTLLIEKTEGGENLIKNADVAVYFDGEKRLTAPDLNLLPEMGVKIEIAGTQLLVEEFVHRGTPSEVPEYLHLGGWQMLNIASIEANLDSTYQGLERAAEAEVELLVTPETSLTGLFPSHPVTQTPAPIADAEKQLRRFIRGLDNAPYLVVGFPAWRNIPEHRVHPTRYNVSRVYDPDGEIVSTHDKVHSAEEDFWHGYQLNEFDVHGVPISMHICHDGRYPELWTLPVMFGTRLVLHPSNGGVVSGSVEAFVAAATTDAATSHAFHLHVNAGGGSYIVGPHEGDGLRPDLIAVSPECRRDNPAFPLVGAAQEGLFEARIRIHNAFGYWPVRSFRSSEAVAEAYLSLYRTLGGRRATGRQ